MSAAPAPGGTPAVILDRVAAAVAAAVPGLDAAGARLLVTEAASRRGALRQLDRHLAAFPDALASGSADAPKAVIALAGLLAGAGYPGIGVARCLACGRPGELPHRSGGGRLCRNCYRRRRQEPCRRCGRTRPGHARTAAGPLCTTCSSHLQPSRTCGACGQDGPVRAWRPDGSAVCGSCYRAPERPCARCGRLAVTRALLLEGPVCRSCCGEPLRRCGGCGLDRPVRLRAADGQPDLCRRCAARPLATCTACGHQGRCDTRDGPPVCMICRTWPAHDCRSCGQARPVMAWWPMGPTCGACCRQIRSSPANCPSCGQHQVLLAVGPGGSRTCGPCAGHPPEFACANCSGTETMPRRGPCARCAMNQQLHATLAHPVLGIPAQLQPLLAHFSGASRPRSVTGWLTGPGGRLLAALAAAAHERQLTHALLDEQTQGAALHRVRDMLVEAGTLPARDEYLERIEPWLGEVLVGRPAQHAALVRPYATWHVLRRARRRSRGRGAFTMSAAGWARGRILVALAFLTWLDDRGTALGAATQADVDDWLHGATRYRYLLRDFLAWASARRLAGQVTVPALPRSELSGLITEDSRWQLLSRCLRDQDIPLDVRTAGALLLLYGQFASRLTRLTDADIEQHGPDTCLRLDTVPVLLPPRLAALVRAQLDAAPAHARTPGSRPLFPGRSTARPVAPQTLTRRLREHGIEPRLARNTALAAWASDLPPAVLASLLGVHIQTAVNWASRTRRDWTAYLAERARVSTPAPRKTARPE
jgi:hypothetical protein